MENLKETLAKYSKPENIIVIILLLVIIMISFNYIFKDEKKVSVERKTEEDTNIKAEESLEKKLEVIINEITGSDDSKVLITYLESEKIIPIYETEETKATDMSSGNIEKKIVYEEVSGDKLVAKEGNVYAKIDGIIIVSSKVESENMQLNIVKAVSQVTSIPEYKVKIFNK